jgi:hypothetical protein
MCWGFGTSDIDVLWWDLSFGTEAFDLVTLILYFDLVLKKLTWAIYFERNLLGFDTSDINALWRDLSFGTKTFNFVTVILNLNLVLKNFHLGYIFWTNCVTTLILQVLRYRSIMKRPFF